MSRVKLYPFEPSCPLAKESCLQLCRKDGGWITTIHLSPGTHHLMFLVDGQMVANPDMPTAVDFNNVLLNFIEIAHEDLQKTRRESKQAEPPQLQHQEGQAAEDDDHDSHDGDTELVAEEILPGDFRQIIPRPLLDMDLPEDDPKFHQASRVIQDCGGPPGLPLFLTKSLLNSGASLKDDNSVLTLPNHTVINHLMTSSVKNDVLATSVTTRYKNKVSRSILDQKVRKADSDLSM